MQPNRSPQSDASPANRSPETATTRRRLLAVGGATAAVGLTGCMGALNAVAGAILEDVNIINGTDQRRSGSITVVDPNGETQLDDSFTVAADDSDDSESESNSENASEDGDGPSSTPTFADVFTDPGEYTVTVELDADSAIDGTTDHGATVAVDDVENQHIIVGLGANQTDAGIDVLVIEEFSDLADQLNESAA